MRILLWPLRGNTFRFTKSRANAHVYTSLKHRRLFLVSNEQNKHTVYGRLTRSRYLLEDVREKSFHVLILDQNN